MELLILVTSKERKKTSSDQGDAVCTSRECILAASVLLQSMNQDIHPCDDFYEYACGNWAKYHPRDDSEESLSWFHEIDVDVSRFIPDFLESKTIWKEPKIIKQIRNMYKACKESDESELHRLDYLRFFHLPKYPAILADRIERIDEPQLKRSQFVRFLKDFDLIDTIAQIKKVLGLDIFFKFEIKQDPYDRTRKSFHIDKPSSFGSAKYGHQTIADWILAFVSSDPYNKLKSYSSVNKSSHHYARLIMKNRNSLAELANKAKTNFPYIDEDRNDQEPKDDEKEINIDDYTGFLSIDALQNSTDKHIAPNKFPFWHKYLTTIFSDVTDPPVDFSQKIFTKQSGLYYLVHLIDYFRQTPKYELQLYMWWRVMEEMLSNSFNEKTNDEDEENKAKLSRSCASYVNNEMEMAVSYGYVKSNAFDEIKSNVTIMLDFIRAAFNESVQDNNEWMDDETKRLAWEKANAMKTFVGFPEWLQADGKLDEYYGDLRFDKSTHFKNLIVARKLQMTKTLKNLVATGETEWAAKPTLVNAVYLPLDNAMTIPLAILQFPFYHLGLEALNYGATGATIGHEFTHGFDDTGVNFDKDGYPRMWWTEDSRYQFELRAECFIKQYNAYHLSEINKNIDGNRTLGENIADAGGLRQAYNAYKAYISKYGSEKILPGFESLSHEQLFFLSYGNHFCGTQTNSLLKKRREEDEHSPARFRVNGVLENSDEFKRSFNCPSSSKMVSTKPCRIW